MFGLEPPPLDLKISLKQGGGFRGLEPKIFKFSSKIAIETRPFFSDSLTVEYDSSGSEKYDSLTVVEKKYDSLTVVKRKL